MNFRVAGHGAEELLGAALDAVAENKGDVFHHVETHGVIFPEQVHENFTI